MAQNPNLPTTNPHDTDRIEELIVNPTILDLAKRRGELDMDGIRFVVIGYGPMYQLLFPYKQGHLSIGIELEADITQVAQKVAAFLDLPI